MFTLRSAREYRAMIIEEIRTTEIDTYLSEEDATRIGDTLIDNDRIVEPDAATAPNRSEYRDGLADAVAAYVRKESKLDDSTMIEIHAIVFTGPDVIEIDYSWSDVTEGQAHAGMEWKR